MSVLIITRSVDNDSVKLVSEHLFKMGKRVIRLDTDWYPTHIKITGTTGGSTRITIGDESTTLDDLDSVWYRRFHAGGNLPHDLGQEYREVCVHESRRTLYGTIAALPCFQLDPLQCVRGTDHKELQLSRALHHGMDVPRTIFTNDADAVREFYHQEGGEIVTKMQSSFAVYPDGEEQVVFTSKVKAEQMEEIENIKYAPMIFQEFLPKKLDIRSTVVGNRVFSAAIDSQKSSLTEVDWRRDGANTLSNWFPYQLPEEIEKKLLAVVADFGLNYAAADFVLTRDDRMVFLEINAGGEWLWMSSHVGLPIDEALAEALTDPSVRSGSR